MALGLGLQSLPWSLPDTKEVEYYFCQATRFPHTSPPPSLECAALWCLQTLRWGTVELELWLLWGGWWNSNGFSAGTWAWKDTKSLSLKVHSCNKPCSAPNFYIMVKASMASPDVHLWCFPQQQQQHRPWSSSTIGILDSTLYRACKLKKGKIYILTMPFLAMWGITFSPHKPTGFLWIQRSGTGTSFIYFIIPCLSSKPRSQAGLIIIHSIWSSHRPCVIYQAEKVLLIHISHSSKFLSRVWGLSQSQWKLLACGGLCKCCKIKTLDPICLKPGNSLDYRRTMFWLNRLAFTLKTPVPDPAVYFASKIPKLQQKKKKKHTGFYPEPAESYSNIRNYCVCVGGGGGTTTLHFLGRKLLKSWEIYDAKLMYLCPGPLG